MKSLRFPSPEIELSPAKQKQPGDRKCDTQEALPRGGLAKKQNPGNCHNRSATSQNRRHGGERPTLLEQQKKGDRSCANADASQNRIEDSFSSRFLVPAAHEPKKCAIQQDRQCRRCLDNESA